MASLISNAKRAVRAVERRRQQGPYQGYVDTLSNDGIIQGWVLSRHTKQGNIAVGLYAGDTLLDTCTANHVREDVRAKTGGDAACGFQFVISDQLLDRISHTNGQLSVRPTHDAKFSIGHLDMQIDRNNPDPDASDTTLSWHALRDHLEDLLGLLDTVLDQSEGVPALSVPPFRQHAQMFSTDHIIPDHPRSGHPAYLDYVRFRYRMDEYYDVEPNLEASDRYLYWYLTAYRAQEKRRTPLSKEIIDYLNAPIVMGGDKFAISRVMWWRLTSRKDLMQSTDFNNRDSYLNLLFWWAHQDCTHLYFEDCLVPDRFADLLRGVHPSRRLDAYPLSYFSERFFKQTPSLRFLKPDTAHGRKTLALAMLLMSVRRPDFLRHMPRSTIDALLTQDETGTSDFERFLNDLREEGLAHFEALSEDTDEDASEPVLLTLLKAGPITLPRDRFVVALRQKGFDLASYSFLTTSPAGDRFEAAAMPIPNPDGEEVDVQLIGPLAKASGLGQATRLSADILRATGLTVRGVDFDLDNPAPVGFSSDTEIEEYGPAKINIIHLNAESIPLAFSYQPDVFSDAYNIGYFFWELDTPAICHYLGMNMLDEIWVSTDYGVQIYKPGSQGRPIKNVGMCFEDNADITREDARAFVNQRFKLTDDHFVCLVAFDSFSFVQRKNPVSVLKAFQKAFEGVPNARLIVKTQNRDSVFDPVQMNLWDQVEAITSTDRRIMVINETLTYKDLLRLKAGSDCYLTLHKSEGWGFGMIEAMSLKVPVVCTAYSGNMDFCSEDTAWLVNYEETLLQKGDYIFIRRGSVWAEPSIDHAAQQLRAAYDNPKERVQKAETAYTFIHENFSTQAIAKRYGDRLKEVLDTLPQ